MAFATNVSKVLPPYSLALLSIVLCIGCLAAPVDSSATCQA